MQKNESSHDKKEKEEETEEDYVIVNDEYKVKYKGTIGAGSFGHVYTCHSIKTQKQYACKLEFNDTLNPQLQHEYKTMKLLEGGGKFIYFILILFLYFYFMSIFNCFS